MLRIQVRHNVKNTVDYFSNDRGLSLEEQQGVWLGKSCSRIGIEQGSTVSVENLTIVLSGRTLLNYPLYQRWKDNRRCAWDCALTTDKSVSIAGLCVDDDVTSQFLGAWNRSIASLLQLLELMAVRQGYDSMGRNGHVETNNMAVAHFVHHSSRHRDPLLHSHLLVVNATRDNTDSELGKWRSLEPSPLYRGSRLINLFFQRELAQQLWRQGIAVSYSLGYPVLKISREICLRLSRAHAAIKEFILSNVRPDKLKGMNAHKYEQYVNDRIRPPKRCVQLSQFLNMISGKERKEIKENFFGKSDLVFQQRLSKLDITRLISEHFIRTSLSRSKKHLLESAYLVAQKFPGIELKQILEAASDVFVQSRSRKNVRLPVNLPEYTKTEELHESISGSGAVSSKVKVKSVVGGGSQANSEGKRLKISDILKNTSTQSTSRSPPGP